jgi:tetratricopeptide (TPR) repeat protein
MECCGQAYGARSMMSKIVIVLAVLFLSKPPVYAETAGDYLNKGEIDTQQGQLDQAITDYAKAIEINPKNDSAYALQGGVYFDLGQFDQAISDYTEAIKIRGDGGGFISYSLGLAQEAQHKFAQAIFNYTKTIEINPDFVSYNKARELNLKYDPNHSLQAISEYTRAIQKNPHDAWAFYARGLTYELQEDYDRAIADFNRAIGINSKFAEAYYGRGIAYYYILIRNKAREDLQMAEELGIKTVDPDIM